MSKCCLSESICGKQFLTDQHLVSLNCVYYWSSKQNKTPHTCLRSINNTCKHSFDQCNVLYVFNYSRNTMVKTTCAIQSNLPRTVLYKDKNLSLNETPEFPFWRFNICVDFDLRDSKNFYNKNIYIHNTTKTSFHNDTLSSVLDSVQKFIVNSSQFDIVCIIK